MTDDEAVRRTAPDVRSPPDKIPLIGTHNGGRVAAPKPNGPLTAPFPWYGGKRRWAPRIWERFGKVGVYVEPFAGSLACLLHNERPAPREIVCDLDGGIANFWRAIIHAPAAVAYWSDYPTIHQDLTARHRWLVRWVLENGKRLENDPDYFCPQAAGWWVWGLSLWIGGGWCQPGYRQKAEPEERRPLVQPTGGGKGVSAQTTPERMPVVSPGPGGRSVSAQARDGAVRLSDKHGSRGVAAQRVGRPDLIEWFDRLAARLKGVVVLNRSWESALTPSLLQQTATGPKPPVGILMDPPYLDHERDADVYGSDAIGTSNETAAASWEWAQEHGERFRIAYCCHEGDADPPDGWDVETQSFAGIRKAERRERRDMVLFSPACVPDSQARLW